MVKFENIKPIFIHSKAALLLAELPIACSADPGSKQKPAPHYRPLTIAGPLSGARFDLSISASDAKGNPMRCEERPKGIKEPFSEYGIGT